MQSQFCHEPGQTVSSHNAADDAVVRQAQRCSNSGPLISVFVPRYAMQGPVKQFWFTILEAFAVQ